MNKALKTGLSLIISVTFIMSSLVCSFGEAEEVSIRTDSIDYDVADMISSRALATNDDWNLPGYNSNYCLNYDYGYTQAVSTHLNDDGTVSVCLIKLDYRQKVVNGVQVDDKTRPTYKITSILDFDNENNVVRRVDITPELDRFDAFTKYGDKYYVLFSSDLADKVKEDPSHKSDVALRVCEYSSSGRKLRSFEVKANVPDSERGIITTDYCNPILFVDDKIVTGLVSKQAFEDEAHGVHYNSFTFAFNKASGQRIEKSSAYHIPYASHGTEAAFIKDGDDYVYAMKGDCYPRAFQLTKMSGANWNKEFDAASFRFKAVTDFDEFLPFAKTDPTGLRSGLYRETSSDFYTQPFDLCNADTHARLAGLILSKDKYMLVGTYERSLDAVASSAEVFVQLFDRSNGNAGITKFLTSYGETGTCRSPIKTVTNCKTVRIADNTVAIAYMLTHAAPQPGSADTKQYDSLELIFIDNTGKVKSRKSLPADNDKCLPHMASIYYNESLDALEWFTLKGHSLIRNHIFGVAGFAATGETELVSSVTPSSSSVKLDPGQCKKITLTYEPETAVNSFVWTSDNESVATVSQDGTITCVGHGTATITATALSGAKTTIRVSPATASPIVSLSVLTPPDKVEYFTGDVFSVDGLTLTAVYADGTSSVVSEGYVCPFSGAFASAGSKVIPVMYKGISTSFTVTVKDPAPVSVTVISMPDKENYVTGEAPDLTGLQVLVTYENGATETVSDGFTVESGEFSDNGDVQTTVSIFGLEFTFTAHVAPADAPDYVVTYYVGASVYKQQNYKAGYKVDWIDLTDVPAGYTFGGWNGETPELMPEHDLTVRAKLNPISYNAVFKADGKVVKTVSYYYGAPSLQNEPAVPQKAGYIGKWPEYMLPVGGVTVTAVYTPVTKTDITVKIKNNPGTKQIKYGESLLLTASLSRDISSDPNVTIAWYTDGKEVTSARGKTTFTLDTKAKSTVVELKLVNVATGQQMTASDGSAVSDSETVTVKSNIFLRIASFFKNLFRVSRLISQKITGIDVS